MKYNFDQVICDSLFLRSRNDFFKKSYINLKCITCELLKPSRSISSRKNANNKRTIKILSLDIADGLWSTRAALDGSTLRHHNESIK